MPVLPHTHSRCVVGRRVMTGAAGQLVNTVVWLWIN
jgi:hypothetical protein